MTDGGTDYGWLNYNGEDVNFAEAMVSWVEANFCVDESRIFSTGMSAGGLMSDMLGCQMPDVFRAIGVMPGRYYTAHASTTRSQPSLPMAPPTRSLTSQTMKARGINSSKTTAATQLTRNPLY